MLHRWSRSQRLSDGDDGDNDGRGWLEATLNDKRDDGHEQTSREDDTRLDGDLTKDRHQLNDVISEPLTHVGKRRRQSYNSVHAEFNRVNISQSNEPRTNYKWSTNAHNVREDVCNKYVKNVTFLVLSSRVWTDNLTLSAHVE